jgi:hypothetical protein
VKILSCSWFLTFQPRIKIRNFELRHFGDEWKAIEQAENNGPNWRGSGVYAWVDAFVKHFTEHWHCRDYISSNKVKRGSKMIVLPTIICQGDTIHRMKTTRTLQCKICMKEIPHHFQTDQPKIMNDNSDIYIYSSFKYKERFDKFCLLSWTTYRDTEDAFAIATKKSTLLELLSQKNRFSFTLSSSRYCQQTTKEVPCNNRLGLRAEVSSTNQWREED